MGLEIEWKKVLQQLEPMIYLQVQLHRCPGIQQNEFQVSMALIILLEPNASKLVSLIRDFIVGLVARQKNKKKDYSSKEMCIFFVRAVFHEVFMQAPCIDDLCVF